MPRAGLDREAVVAAAARIADTEGLEALNLARLAREFGVKPPSLYNHVGGLADLHRELALRGARQLNRQMANAAVGRASADAVMALGLAYRDFARAHPGLYAAVQRAPASGDPDLDAVAGEVVDTVVAVLSGFGLSGDDAIHATRGLRAIVHGFVSLEVGGGFGIPLDVEESFRRLLATFCQGLGR